MNRDDNRKRNSPVYGSCRRCGHHRMIKPERERTGLCRSCYLTGDQPPPPGGDYTAAACADKPLEWWFPADDVLGKVHDPYSYGRRLCNGEPATGLPPCPVRERCLADALRAETGRGEQTRHGMFGGLGPRHRARLERGQGVAA